MRDSKNKIRKRIAALEVDKMVANYHSECRELGERMETPKEKEKRMKRREQEKRHKDRYWIK